MFYVYVTKAGVPEITEHAEDVPVTANVDLITEDREEANIRLAELRA